MNTMGNQPLSDTSNKDFFEIDLKFYLLKLWKSKFLLGKFLCLGLIVGIIISFSIPKTYKATAVLAPEVTQTGGAQMSGMVAMLGFGGMGGAFGRDAISINSAEDIVSTTPFLLELMKIHVNTTDEERNITIVDYLSLQKRPWWNTIFSLPQRLVGGILSLFQKKSESPKKVERIDPFRLTLSQEGRIAALGHSISAQTDKKTGLIEISATFQDPLVAAMVTDSVMVLLQDYLIKYRTNKVSQDCDYLSRLHKEMQQKYYDAQKLYAGYVDANQNIIRRSVSAESERLQNEMNLAYQMYSQVSTQLQMSQAKLQEVKPSFTVVEPSRVPLKAISPNKKLIVIGFCFLFVLFSSAWILFIDEWVIQIKNLFKS